MTGAEKIQVSTPKPITVSYTVEGKEIKFNSTSNLSLTGESSSIFDEVSRGHNIALGEVSPEVHRAISTIRLADKDPALTQDDLKAILRLKNPTKMKNYLEKSMSDLKNLNFRYIQMGENQIYMNMLNQNNVSRHSINIMFGNNSNPIVRNKYVLLGL